MTNIATKMTRIKFESIQETLQATSANDKAEPIAIQTAVEFNRVLSGLGDANPEIKPHLPSPINTKGFTASTGTAEITYIDLEMLVRQIQKVFDLLDEE